MQIEDHAETALEHVDKADGWANRDGNFPEGHRGRMVDQELRLAEIHATLAVAQRIDRVLGHLEDRVIAVEVVRE